MQFAPKSPFEKCKNSRTTYQKQEVASQLPCCVRLLSGFSQLTEMENLYSKDLTTAKTRMHSSRMRTAHVFTVCWSLLPRGVGGVPGPRGVVVYLVLGGTCLVPGGTCLVRGVTCLVWGCTCLVQGVYLVRYSPLWTE